MMPDIKGVTPISTRLYKDYSSLDIVAFSFAVPGAQGEGGGIYLITSDQNIYHMNFVFGDMTKDDAIHICPPLVDCRFALFGADKIPEGWQYRYMGAGNHLFIRDSIFNDVYEMTVGLEEVELYQQWKYIVMKVLGKWDKSIGENEANIEPICKSNDEEDNTHICNSTIDDD